MHSFAPRRFFIVLAVLFSAHSCSAPSDNSIYLLLLSSNSSFGHTTQCDFSNISHELVYDGTPEITNGWQDITFGEGRFVAVADSGTKRALSSTDGETWVTSEVPEQNSWSAVAYGNGQFVAVATSGTNRTMLSANGINWTAHPAAEQNTWTAITYGNGIFLAVASN